ncbi:MAG: GAF domain-containing protein [Holophagaceae bacterium]|nr:GAF domain-containing protein [Holophagaceae bacterium]
MAIFAAISVTLLAAGYGYYRREAEEIRQEKYEEIAAIGELKSSQIQQWRKERLADAGRFAGGPTLSRAVADFLLNPSSSSYQAALLVQLNLDRMGDQYHAVLLFAPDGRMALSTAGAPTLLDPATKQVIAAALANHEPVLSDFFREPDGFVHLDAAAAVRDATGQPLAVMVLRSHAETYLFPLIQSWPTPSPSAETLVFRRDGEEVLYLNKLRHRPNTAMTLRLPISRTDLPAARAVLGEQGKFQGRDYRNVEVLADLRPIPNSPWFMVAKVDADEILGEARYRAGMIGLMVVSLILFAAAATGYFYRHQQAGLFRELYDSEHQQREAQKAFRTTLYSIGDGVITTDQGGFVQEMNPVAEKLTGWLEADARGEPLERIFQSINEETRATVDNPVDKVLRSGAVVALANHTLLIARDGTERPIADSAAPIRQDNGSISGVVLVFSDQTTQRAAQKELRRSEQHLRAIIEAEPECVKLIDPSGNLLEMNPAGLAMLDAESFQEVQAPGLLSFVLPDFHEAFRALHERVMNGESGTLEFRVAGLKGTQRWLETHAVPLRDASGRVSMLLGITRDTTDRKAAVAGLLQRSRQLAVLSTASQRLNTVLETPWVLRQLVATALELTLATDGAAALYLDGKMVFKEYNLHGKLMPVQLEFEAGYGVPGWVMQTREPYMANDAEHDPHVIPETQKALGFHNLADVPIINRHGGLLGCFEIHNKPGGFNDTDLLMLQGLAASAAIALENAGLLAERKQAEEALLQSEAELKAAQRIARVGSWRLDNATNHVFWTEELYRMLGLDPGQPPPNYTEHQRLFTTESWDRLSAALARTQGTGAPYELELEMVRPGQSNGWMLAFGEPVRDASGAIVGLRGAAQDITYRKTAEARIQRLTQLYLALSQCNQAIVRSTDEGELFTDLCRSAVIFGGMKMAWIGLVDRPARRVAPVASYGDDNDYLKGIHISLDADDPQGCGPTGTAAREDRPFWCQDFQNDPWTTPWREGGSISGWLASAALPLHRNGVVIGTLTLYSGQINAFDEEAQNLLMEMATDISHALDSFETEAQRRRTEETLRASLREKESLVKEVHHRVKNNLQVITSLLRLEASRSAQPDTKSVLKGMQNRIRSMALLHESLYRSENLERVDLPAYIKQLTAHLFRSVAAEPSHIQLELDLEPASLPLEQAVPCGLLVNELVSNALKHGFPGGRTGKVRIELRSMDEGRQITLRVIDTGAGLPADFESRRATSLGLQLVSDLVKQLKGHLEISNGPGTGAVFEVAFEPNRQADPVA